MAKQAVKNRQSVRSRLTSGRWPWPLLVIGLLLLVVAAVLWQVLLRSSLNDQLLRKVPADSYVAGVAKLSSLNYDTIKQLSNSANSYPQQTTSLVDALNSAGTNPKTIGEALENQFSFAASRRGNLAIFRVKDEAAYDELKKSLSSKLENQQTGQAGSVAVTSGNLAGTPSPLVIGRAGEELYVASAAELIAGAAPETNGFVSVEQFRETASQLPAGADAYVFYNLAMVDEGSGSGVPLLATALKRNNELFDVVLQSADSSPVASRLERTSGSLLPPAELAAGSIEGINLSNYLQLLEEQRQENNIPRVLAFQNGLASLNRTLGVDIEREYLQAANGHFSYSRFRNTEGGTEWMGAVEFPDTATAEQKVSDLKTLLAQKLTVPVRREVVTILPDQTQSREIVAEGRNPLEYTDFSVEGKTGSAFTVPGGLDRVHFLVEDKYLLIGSSQEAIARMQKVVANSSEAGSEGSLAVRLKLSEAASVPAEPDVFSEWVLATRPSTGELRLNPATGVLEGTVDFDRQE